MVSIQVGISVALVEIVVGAVGGNLPVAHLIQQTDYITFLASLGSVLLALMMALPKVKSPGVVFGYLDRDNGAMEIRGSRVVASITRVSR
jgi:hypothetical protein